MAEERLHGAAESAWMLSPKGEEILRGQALSPERLALRWCVDSNRGEGIVSRLLERLWLLSPSSQGQVIFAVPSTAEPPPADLMDLSEYLLRFYQRLWVPLVQLWCPRWNQVLPEPSLDTTALAQRSEERLASHWPRFSTEAQRRAAVQQQLNAQLRTFLFGDIAPPEAVETWQRRMDWAGLSLRLSGETGGRIWFPVGVFRDKTHPAFQFIPGIASANRTYAVYAPEWSAIRASFADTLFLAYQIEQKLHSTTYVSLLVVRDQVCQQLRLGHFRFVDSLQQAFEESVAGSCPYHISLEVDRTPSELQRQARELPIEIDSAPRYIVAMQRR